MERWFTELEIFKVIKQNLRLSLFILFILTLTIYLFIDTSGASSINSTGAINELPVDITDELSDENISDESETVIGGEDDEHLESEEVVMDPNLSEEVAQEISTDDIFKEDRASFVADDVEFIDNHHKITENDQFALYLKEENLSLIIRDKDTGAVMYSTVEDPQGSNEQWTNFMKSAVVVQYLVGTNIVYYQADMYSEDPETVIEYTNNGFVANIYYPELGISFDLSVSLDGNDIVVHIPEESIEESEDLYKIGNIYIYPFMGYTKLDEEPGYMLIPDGSGATISLENNNGQYKQPYSQMVYGSNIGIDDPYVLSLMYGMVTTNEPNNILSPIFGINHEDKQFGYIGIIEEGDWSAHIQAYPNGAILPYNWITSRFTYRQFYNQSTSQSSGTMVIRQRERNSFDITVRYRLISSEEANYMGMAKNYREYLLDNEIIKPQNYQDAHVMRLDFLGADIENNMFGKRTVPVTTIKQADEILEDLTSSGVEDVMVVYKGWQSGGIYGGLAQNSYTLERNLGSMSELSDLIGKYGDTSRIYLYDDALRFNPDMQNDVWVDLTTKYNKRVFRESIHGKVFSRFNFLQPDEAASRLDSRLNSIGDELPNMVLTGISNNVFSYLEDTTENSRIITGDIFGKSLEQTADQKNLMLETPFQPYWQYTNAFIDFPINSSGYIFESESIPFLSLVMHGLVPFYTTYTNFQSNQTDFFLKLIESGARPSYLLTYEDSANLYNTNSSYIFSSEFDNYREEIISMYNEFEAVQEAVEGNVITEYIKDGDNVIVVYENDVKVLINYSEETQTIGNVELEPKSYRVVK